MTGNGQKRQDDLGFGYKSEYTDKRTNQNVVYIKVLIKAEQLAKLHVNQRGYIELSIFPMTGLKKSAKSPDVVVKPTLSRKNGAAAGVSSTANAGKVAGNALPF